MVSEDVTERLKAPKIEKKAPEVLTVEEAARLLEQPGKDAPKDTVSYTHLDVYKRQRKPSLMWNPLAILMMLHMPGIMCRPIWSAKAGEAWKMN